MAKPIIEAVTDATLDEFAEFLHQHLSHEQSAAQWADRFRAAWTDSRPNYGFVLRDAGNIVGGIGAFYAERTIRGQLEKTCNITSWCVLDAYRQQSMRLAMSVIGQPGYHFTDFSPTKVVSGTLQFFKFRPLDERQAVLLNLPSLLSKGKVLDRRAEIEAALEGPQLQIYREHADFPWLRHIVLGMPGDWCHIIYKRRTFKGFPAASVIYLSNGETFCKYFRRLGGYFLVKGLISTHVECRFLPYLPSPSAVRSGFNPKLYLSQTLQDGDIDYLYSETVALDL